jgi:hypothetical protein
MSDGIFVKKTLSAVISKIRTLLRWKLLLKVEAESCGLRVVSGTNFVKGVSLEVCSQLPLQ